MWLLVTIAVFLFARWLAIKINNPLANPLLISIAILIPMLTVLKIPFETYYSDNQWISYMLQPAVVALAYPLYEQLPQIKANWRIIALACTLGSVMSMLTAMLIAVAFKADISLIASLLGKSVTTPIAMEISSHLGAKPPLLLFWCCSLGCLGQSLPTQSITCLALSTLSHVDSPWGQFRMHSVPRPAWRKHRATPPFLL